MSDQLQYKQPVIKVQSPLVKWINILSPLYQRFVPVSIRFRKNYQLAKFSDVHLLALLCWQVELGMTNQRLFYRFLLSIGFTGLPERSRFNRISIHASEIFKWIRSGLIKTAVPNPVYTIIDIFPMPLCHPIRNRRARLLKPDADIGYNSTKRQWYYGFKGSFEVTNYGIPVAYTITKASIHDINMVPTLIDQYSCPHILADAGYLSKKLKINLSRIGVDFWTPKRKNMHSDGTNSRLLTRNRRQIETVFSRWGNTFDLERNRARSLDGFKTRIEQCLLVDTLKQIN